MLEVGQPFITVTLDADGGNVIPATKSYLRRSKYTDLPEPTKTNYVFMGWNGKNMFTGFEKGIGVNTTDGEVVESSTLATSDYIPVDFTQNNYYLSGLTDTLYSCVIIYDNNKNFLGRTSGEARTSLALNTTTIQSYQAFNTADAKYIRITQYPTSLTTGTLDDLDDLNTQLEIGEAATTFEPYYIESTTDITNDDNHSLKAIWVKKAEFATDSWYEIVKSYKVGATENLATDLANGTLKEVELDMDHDGTAETTAHVRIANLSKETDCSTSGFSQTACGFVIEFADIIDEHRINPSGSVTNGYGNKGGWQYSDIRAYLNGTTYTAGNIDYSGSGIIDALPNEVRREIIETTVVSGHGPNDGSNFVTTDKLYLLDPNEVVGPTYNDGYNTARPTTRQLDYYETKGVTPTNYADAEKNDIVPNHYPWYWYRSAYSRWAANFYSNDAGNVNVASSEDSGGVSPAFRIAK